MHRLVRRILSFAVLAPLLVGLTGCGSNPVGPGGGPSPSPTPAPPPAAAITVTAAGKLVVHPSADRTFAVALETPLKIQETAGGTAEWAYARISLIKGGKEVERNDFGVTDLRAAGVSSITPKSSNTYHLIFRFNASDFDEVTVTLGFQDVNTLRKFTVDVPFNSFSGVDINLTPMSVPSNRVERVN